MGSDKSNATGEYLQQMYEVLEGHFGNLYWWPGETPFEIAVGAILTQNTNWKNVERAIDQLKSNGLLSPKALQKASDDRVAELIRPSGYYNVKTKRLKAFLNFLEREFEGSMDRMFKTDLWALRSRLLRVNGIGEETADSILLYAGKKPIFVVDGYTRRILERHGIIGNDWSYDRIQKLYMINIPGSTILYNQYHALLVSTGKHYCKKTPLCTDCPLQEMKYNEII
ncbi:MAG: endonuclease III domain-containing protein [Deltaproteobacteria bacterium]|nr:endonuclease III domain-containing protein [Deltaproteobacteria bacterium]